MEELVGVTVCSGKYQEAVAHVVQVAAAAAPGPQHGCVGHTPRICVPPLDQRSRPEQIWRRAMWAGCSGAAAAPQRRAADGL
eukprot:COSAG04_NODE_98_length_26386_cov_21.212729_9_plen_82_part_00